MKAIGVSIFVTVLGTLMTVAMGGIAQPIGCVFIGIGGVLLVYGMRQKKRRGS